MTKREPKVSINMRARKSDVEIIDRAADAIGVTRSALIRHAAEVHARRILALPEDDSERGDSGKRRDWYGKPLKSTEFR